MLWVRPDGRGPEQLLLPGFHGADGKRLLSLSGCALWRTFRISNLLLSLLITVSLYTLPVVLYRFVFRKAPVERKKAKKSAGCTALGRSW